MASPVQEKEVPLGAKMKGGPNAIGFDYFYGFTHARNIGTIIEQDAVVAHVEPVANQPLMIKKAVEWIDDRAKAKEPFFLYFPMCPPHEPIVPGSEFAGKSGAQDVVKKNPKYGDWVYQGDAMLGQIIDAVDRNQLGENTLIIATSDNGAEHRAYAPLRESKRSIYEGGHRVPFVARWTGKVKAGTVSAHVVCLNDLMATAAEILAINLPDNSAEDSVSLVSALLGTTRTSAREATVHQSAAGDLAIRQGPWKLIYLKEGSRELYDIANDIGETKDVLSSNPEVATKLGKIMERYIETGRSNVGAPQKNDFNFTLPGPGKPKGNAKKGAFVLPTADLRFTARR